MKRLSVLEWQYVPVAADAEGALTREEANGLLKICRRSKLGGDDGTSILTDHHRRLRAKQVVGIVATPQCELEILPKIEAASGDDNPAVIRNHLVHMLVEALDIKVDAGALSRLSHQSNSMLEVIIRLFADKLLAEVRRGLPRRYQQHHDDLNALRGQLDLVRQFTVLAATPQKLACRFDDLSSNIPLMQIMKAAVIYLGKFARLSETQRRLTELRHAFVDVADIPVSQLPWRKIRIDRTNQRWRELHSLAELFLRSQKFQTTSSDDTAGFALLFEMNMLFESWVARRLARQLRPAGYSVTSQGGLRYCLEDEESGKQLFQTKPDIIVRHGSSIAAIIDTKWKRIKNSQEDHKLGVGQSDVYQMMAYRQVYGCPQLMLLYPHHHGLEGEPGAQSAHLIRSKPSPVGRLSTWTIDVFPNEAVFAGQLLEELEKRRDDDFSEGQAA